MQDKDVGSILIEFIKIENKFFEGMTNGDAARMRKLSHPYQERCMRRN